MRRYSNIAALAITLLVLASVTAAYSDRARKEGADRLADSAFGSLVTVGQVAAAHGTTSERLSNTLEDASVDIDALLFSDAAVRVADAAKPIGEAWLAYRSADQLWRLSDSGVDQPRVSQVYASDRLLQAFPELKAEIVSHGADARFDDRELKVVRRLFVLASRRRDQAAYALGLAQERP